MTDIDIEVYDINHPGDVNCKHCGGDGVIPVVPDPDYKGPPEFLRCTCMLKKDILANVERGYKGLSMAKAVKASPLSPCLQENVWVTASKVEFLRHLRHVAIRMPPTWHFRVTSDLDLMSSWLAGLAVKGKEIMDADVADVAISTEHLTLVDLAVPPDLLIIRTGVKAARNGATPEVLLEALTVREHRGLPTWVWDQPDYVLGEGHISYSRAVASEMSRWKRVKLSEVAPRVERRNHLSEDAGLEWVGTKETPTADSKLAKVGNGETGVRKKTPSWKKADQVVLDTKPKAKVKDGPPIVWDKVGEDEEEHVEEDPVADLMKARGKVVK